MTTLRSHDLLRLTGLLLLSLTGALYGCDGDAGDAVVPCVPPPEAPAGPVVVQIDCAAYAPADSIIVSFRNTSHRSYLYGPCGVSLERRDGDAWAAVEGRGFGADFVIPQTGDVFCDVCQAYGLVLQSDAEHTLGFLLYAGLRVGAYRVRTELSVEPPPSGERETVLGFSNEFTVRR